MPPTTEHLPGGLHALVWEGSATAFGPRRPATPFLLVHGLSSNGRTWEAVGEHLSRDGHAVAAVDLRGHGRSDKPHDGYDFATLTDDLLGVLDALGWERPVVAGQSTGGNLALELALKAPERVRGVVGVDGGLLELADEWPTWEECMAALSPPPLAGRPVGDFEADIRRSHPHWTDEAVAATMANMEVLADGTIRPRLTRERHLRVLRALWEQRPSALLSGLAVPLLLLLAEGDDRWAAAKRREVQRARATTERLRVVWFEPGDHDLHLEQPTTVAGVLAGALADGFLG